MYIVFVTQIKCLRQRAVGAAGFGAGGGRGVGGGDGGVGGLGVLGGGDGGAPSNLQARCLSDAPGGAVWTARATRQRERATPSTSSRAAEPAAADKTSQAKQTMLFFLLATALEDLAIREKKIILYIIKQMASKVHKKITRHDRPNVLGQYRLMFSLSCVVGAQV